MKTLNHIHIPRTGGVYLRNHTIATLKSLSIDFFASNHYTITKENFLNKKFISGHFARTADDFIDTNISFTILRDPVDRYVSNFLYISKNHSMSEFEKWLYDDQIINIQSNLQSRCISSKINIEKYNETDYRLRPYSAWFIGNDTSISRSIQFLDYIDFVWTYDNMNSAIDEYQEILYKNFGISPFSNKNKMNSNHRSIKITKEHRDIIENINSIDMEIYEYARNKEKRHKLAIY